MTDANDRLKLAKALCKWSVDAETSDTPDVIWSQMRSSVQEAFLVHADKIIGFIADQLTADRMTPMTSEELRQAARQQGLEIK